jgi:hypothetical protein
MVPDPPPPAPRTGAAILVALLALIPVGFGAVLLGAAAMGVLAWGWWHDLPMPAALVALGLCLLAGLGLGALPLRVARVAVPVADWPVCGLVLGTVLLLLLGPWLLFGGEMTVSVSGLDGYTTAERAPMPVDLVAVVRAMAGAALLGAGIGVVLGVRRAARLAGHGAAG